VIVAAGIWAIRSGNSALLGLAHPVLRRVLRYAGGHVRALPRLPASGVRCLVTASLS
jgi:hypothetical protein